MSKMTFGADPEFFLINKQTGLPVSAVGLVPGTKKEPSPLPNGGSVQVDGLAVEFNTVPVENAKDFNDSVESCLKDIRKIVPSNYQFLFKAAIEFPKEYFDSLPDSNKELGCDPDYSVDTKDLNPIPKNVGTWRTASGHLHVGWGTGLEGPTHFDDCVMFVGQMDSWFFYSHLAYYSNNRADLTLEQRRRTMYGKRGAFRPKPYGVEYRTPSNLWLAYDKAHRMWLFNKTHYLFDYMVTGFWNGAGFTTPTPNTPNYTM